MTKLRAVAYFWPLPSRSRRRLPLRPPRQVSGKLVLGAYKPPPAARRESKRPSYNWELENGFKEVRPDRVDARRELAVVLLGEGEPPAGEPASR